MEKELTKITIENYGHTFTWEVPYNDVELSDVIHSFYSMLIGMTYNPDTVIDKFKEFVETHEKFSN